MFKIKKYIISLITILSLQCSYATANEKEVVDFIDKVANQMIKIAANKQASVSSKRAQICNLINRDFDTEWMSKFTLGRSFRELSDSQKQEYQSLYANYLCNNYSPILSKYKNESYSIKKVSKTGKKDYNVDVVILRENNAPPIKLRYHIKQKENSYQAVDMLIEGVSTIISQRSEFSYIVKNNGIDGLLKSLTQGNLKKHYNIE